MVTRTAAGLTLPGPAGSTIHVGHATPARDDAGRDGTERGRREWSDALGHHVVVVTGPNPLSDSDLDEALTTGQLLTRPRWYLDAMALQRLCTDAGVDLPPGIDRPEVPGEDTDFVIATGTATPAQLRRALEVLMGLGGCAAELRVRADQDLTILHGTRDGLTATFVPLDGGTGHLSLDPSAEVVARTLHWLRLNGSGNQLADTPAGPSGRVEVRALRARDGKLASIHHAWIMDGHGGHWSPDPDAPPAQSTTAFDQTDPSSWLQPADQAALAGLIHDAITGSDHAPTEVSP